MSGIFWHIFSFGVIVIFLIVVTYRTVTIIRLPVHLRWELAPIPHEKGKSRYGGSYLEDYEWWHRSQHRSRIAPIMYMAKEIFLLRGVWKYNRSLWPFSFTLHMGIYLIIVMLFLQVINAVFIIVELPASVQDVFRGITSVFALGGYLFGSVGAISLILKRALDSNLRPFNTVVTYFRLLFLGAVFISGAYVCLSSQDFVSEMSLFTKGLVTLDPGVAVASALSTHLVISLLFLLYLPLTDMIHFIAKFFTYHEIRWDDKPKNEKMEKELRDLLAQPVTWSAAHVKDDSKKTWVDVTTEEVGDEEKA